LYRYIAWHPLTMLAQGEGKKYFFVKPFVQPLLKWIKTNKKSLMKNGMNLQGGNNVAGVGVPAMAAPVAGRYKLNPVDL
jgi:hypothetical protein